MSEADGGEELRGKSLYEVGHFLGPDRLYDTPEALLKECARYFRWVELNPIKSEKAFGGKNGIQKTDMKHLRAMTMEGLCTFIGVSIRSFNDWGRPNSRQYREDLSPVVSRVKQFMREQKLSGAAAGVFNPMIIARDLKLREHNEISGPDGGPIETVNSSMTTMEKSQAFRDMLESSKDQG